MSLNLFSFKLQIKQMAYNVKIYNILSLNYILCIFRIYSIHDKGIAFTTVEDILKAMDPRFVESTKQTVKAFLKEEGFGDKFIDEFVMSTLQSNYGQTTDVAGFVGGWYFN